MRVTQAELIAGAESIQVPIEKLHLDVNNVRFKHLGRKLSPEVIEKTIRQEDDTNELSDQILADGHVYEPLIISSDYVVLEGNRRLVALRMLNEQVTGGKLDGLPIDKFNKVACRILPRQIDDRTTDLYLASVHVKSKKPWKLFNRARHIYRLNRIHGVSYDLLAEHLGMGKVTIQRNILVYHSLLEYNRKYPEDSNWYHNFSYYDELFKRKELKEYQAEKTFLPRFTSWIHEGKLQNALQVRQLARILADKRAYSEFLKKDVPAALKVLEEVDPSFSNQRFRHINNVIDAMKSFPRTELEEIRGSPAKMKMLYKLESEVKSLLAELEAMRTVPREVIS